MNSSDPPTKWIISSIAKPSVVSGALDACFFSSTFCGLWHKSILTSVVQTNQQHTWRKKGYGCPWLCSLRQILQCFAPEANPNLVYTTTKQLHLWGFYLLLPRRLWGEAGPARALRCSSILHFSGINSYGMYIKEPSRVSLDLMISTVCVSIGKSFSQSQ